MSEWENYKVENLVNYKKGYAFKSSFYDQEGDHFIVRVSDTTENSINIKTCHKIRKENVQGLDAYIIRHNDVVIATVGSWADNPQSIVGKVIRVPRDANGAYLNQNAVRLRSNGKVTQDYLYFVLKNKEFSDYLLNSAQGSANQASITLKDIFSYRVTLPPVPEQKAIASVLSSLDDKIDLLHRQNKTLEAMAETLFRQWFIEEAREDWEEFHLKELVSVVDNRGKTPPYTEEPTDHPIIEVNALTKNGRAIDYAVIRKYVNTETFNTWFRQYLQPLDIVLSTVGSIGSFGMFFGGGGCVAQNIIGLRAKTKISNFFLYQWLVANTDEIKELDIGSVQPSIKVPHLLSLTIKVPNSEKLQQFDTQAATLVQKILTNTAQIQTLETQRDTLLPKLMSGEVRVQYQTEQVA